MKKVLLLMLAVALGLGAARVAAQRAAIQGLPSFGEPGVSPDGTAIAFDRSGAGRPVILVGGALSDRSAAVPLAAILAPRFSVFAYDRRGRGDSGDTPPYAVAFKLITVLGVLTLQDALAQWQVTIDTSCQLTDKASSHQQFLVATLRISRYLAQRFCE